MESLSIPFYVNPDVTPLVRGSISAAGALKEVYTKIPTIMVSTQRPTKVVWDAMGEGSALQLMITDTMNVNLFISTIAISTEGKVTFTIEASDGFFGDAAVTVLGLG